MLALVLVSVLGLVHGQSSQFNCRNLLPLGFSGGQNNVDKFSLSMAATKFEQGDKVKVVLQVHDDDTVINQFILQARPVNSPDTVVGLWELDSPDTTQLTMCARHGDTVESKARASTTREVAADWVAPYTSNGIGDINFVATVVDPAGGITVNIKSAVLLEFRQSSVHDLSREEEEEENEDTEEAGGINDEEEEEVNPNGGEDPNEPERIQEEERQESLDRDYAGGEEPRTPQPAEEGEEFNDHGLNREVLLQIEWQRKQDELNRDEEQQGEGQWVIIEEERRQEDEALRHWEMWKYEHDQEEYERKRMEMMQWEIRDKEEHDRLEEDKHINDTPKDDDTVDEDDDIDDDVLEGEVDLEDDKLDITAGGVSIVASLLTTALMLVPVHLL